MNNVTVNMRGMVAGEYLAVTKTVKEALPSNRGLSVSSVLFIFMADDSGTDCSVLSR